MSWEQLPVGCGAGAPSAKVLFHEENLLEHSRARAANQQETAERKANWIGFLTVKEKEKEPQFYIWAVP